VTGYTGSTDFPTATPFQVSNGGGDSDVFVTKLNAAGSALIYSTYLGGSNPDIGFGIAMDTPGSVYVTGETRSTDFPTATPLQSSIGGGSDAFVAKLNAAGSALVYSTYLGGSSDDRAGGIAVAPSSNAYVVGRTDSTDFPTATPVQAAHGGGSDTFITKIINQEVDSEGDGIPDAEDNCPAVANPDQADTDGDGVGNLCDNCVAVANPEQIDTDGNGVGDACEGVDTDGDGIVDAEDNCPTVANADQADSDGDEVGDTCDNCPSLANSDQTDTDGDGIGDLCEALISGGGDPTTDCFAEWLIKNPFNTLFPWVCSDGDPTCDFDTVVGQCTFAVTLCFNNIDPELSTCSPTDVASVKLRRPNPLRPEDVADATNVLALEDALTALGGTVVEPFVLFSPPLADIGTCTELGFIVPLKSTVIGFRKGSKPLKVETAPSVGSVDADSLRLTCLPGS
jgi:hypothetical protein